MCNALFKVCKHEKFKRFETHNYSSNNYELSDEISNYLFDQIDKNMRFNGNFLYPNNSDNIYVWIKNKTIKYPYSIILRIRKPKNEEAIIKQSQLILKYCEQEMNNVLQNKKITNIESFNYEMYLDNIITKIRNYSLSQFGTAYNKLQKVYKRK